MKHSACMQSRRSPKSVRPRATTKVKPATKIEKTRGNDMDLGNLDNANKTDDQETRQEEFDPWQKYAGQGSEVLDASGVPRWLNVRASFSRAVKKGTMG